MRLECVHTITNKTWLVEVPIGKNPVRIGSHPACDVQLNSPYIAAEAATVANDPACGDGWVVWNRSDRPLVVGDTRLAARDDNCVVPTRTFVLRIYPFALTVSLAASEWFDAGLSTDRDNRLAAEFVRSVHRELVDRHPNDPGDRSEWLTDAYIHRLEQDVVSIASSRPEFPRDEYTTTDLGWHLAGVAIRSELLARAARKGDANPNRDNQRDWSRPRTSDPGRDAEADAVVAAAYADLRLGESADLTGAAAILTKKFHAHWSEMRRSASPPRPRAVRTLALRRLVREIKDAWYGFGPLEDLFSDPDVTEIMVVDPDRIFVEKNGRLEDSGRSFLTDPVAVARRLIASANRDVNTTSPMADAMLPDGSRVNVVLAPIAVGGVCVTIRRFAPGGISMDQLVSDLGSLTPSTRDVLRACVRGKRNIIVSGGTGTGKTTLLNALASFIPERERVVTVEDTAELKLPGRHVVTLQSRPANQDGAGAVTVRDLVRNALRMRPDRIVVGECRGGEAIDMLQAMNTGHDGSMTTLHANNPEGVLRRLEVLVQQNGDADLPVATIHAQVAAAVDLIVQLGIITGPTGRRRVVTAIAELVADGPGGLSIRTLFSRDLDNTLRPTGRLPTFLPDLIESGLLEDPAIFVLHGEKSGVAS